MRDGLRRAYGSAPWRRRDGAVMSELSRLLLVSNGTVTAVVACPQGADAFKIMPRDHKIKVAAIMGRLSQPDPQALQAILFRARGTEWPPSPLADPSQDNICLGVGYGDAGQPWRITPFWRRRP
ncbi:hypothetical protein [Paracoccus sp. Ld10]|uniref:hypothetical protein n=1 Tax=Paracoccus sp. Ld10 TaxID=649158 RepID=UPI003864A4F4